VFRIAISNRAEKALKRYGDSRVRLLELFSVLRDNPVPAEYYDVKKVVGRDEVYRVRLGGMRVVYGVDWVGKSVVIYEFLPRGRVYKGI
jgi:mRNA interferase RelE/StbE